MVKRKASGDDWWTHEGTWREASWPSCSISHTQGQPWASWSSSNECAQELK